MFIRKTKVKGITYYQIVETIDGKQKVKLHLGTADKIYENAKTKQNPQH